MRELGTVVHWDPVRKFGFIKADHPPGSPLSGDVFFHVSGFDDYVQPGTLSVGSRVEFELTFKVKTGGRRYCAQRLRLMEQENVD